MMPLSSSALRLQRHIREFAGSMIAVDSALHKAPVLPRDIWRQMTEKGIVGIGVPKQFNGQDGGWVEIAVASEALTSGGRNIGVALSWLLHTIVMRFVLMDYGTQSQIDHFMPDLAGGNKIACFAVSEPEVGAHPKHLTTTAEIKGDHAILNGSKTYLTNGPIADVFLVVAITGFQNNRKQFSGFIVPRETPGLQVTEPLDFPYLRPAAHGGILLKNCVVPNDYMLFADGGAYDKLVRPFRRIEDAAMMGPMAGALGALLAAMARMLKKNETSAQSVSGMDLGAAVGELKIMADTAKILAWQAAAMLDANAMPPGIGELDSLTLFSRHLARTFFERLEILVEMVGIQTDPHFKRLAADCRQLLKIAQNVAQIRQMKIGNKCLENSGQESV